MGLCAWQALSACARAPVGTREAARRGQRRVAGILVRVLIRNAKIWRGGLSDLRIEAGHTAAFGKLEPLPGERVIEAQGGALLPGLHDHHIHLPALAAARASVRCGPPEVTDEAELAAALNRPGQGWLRGIGYHESVAGMLDDRM